MKITDPAKLKIGQWFARCCTHDLYQIESQDTIDEIISEWEDDDWPTSIMPKVYETEDEALMDLK